MKASAATGVQAAWGRVIAAALQTDTLGQPLLAYDVVDSTSDVVKEMAGKDAPEGLTVVAAAQRRGRGRRGRDWLSLAGRGVYMSVLLRPDLSGSDMGWLAVLGGVSTACALERVGLREITVMWPNDVLCRGRKIGGVLVEPRMGGATVDFAVVGLGVNVGHTGDEWPDALKDIATSCHMEGVDVECSEVTLRVLEEMDKWYGRLRTGKQTMLLDAWAAKGGTRKIPVLD